MKYFDMFAGAGGFSIGIEKALQKSECVGYSEIDKYAIQTYEKNYPNHKNYGDCKEIDWNQVADFDLLVGGSPCQDLSVAGKRQGLTGERSGLFAEYIRALKEKKPRYFIWENVKGALSSNKGWDFAQVLFEMEQAGYDVQWQVLNAKDSGVPQNRERVFVVGHLRGESRPEVFPIGESNGDSEQRDRKRSYSSTIQTNSTRCRGTHIVVLNKPRHSNQRLYSTNGLSPTLNTMQGGNRQPFINTDPVRRLTPLECERLMGWSDSWTEGVSDTQRYKQCGNGVVSNCVEEIVSRLIK